MGDRTIVADSAPDASSVRHEFVFEAGPTSQCHASTLAFVGEELVVTWFGGSREGADDVAIWCARRVDGAWSAPELVAEGRSPDGGPWPCWNPVLYAWPSGHLDLFFKVGPSPRRWWGMRCVSRDGGRTWSEPRRLPEGFVGPVKNKPIDLEDGRLLCGSSREGVGWQVHVEWAPPPFDPQVSDPSADSESGGDAEQDSGWDATPAINRGLWPRAIQPALLRHSDGRIQMLCRTRSGRVAESWSDDDGRTWQRLRLTELPDAASGLDAVSLDDGRHLLVYNHSRRGRSPLNVAISEDGRSWQAAAILESGDGEYSYPSVVQGPSGRVHAVYTWHRRRIRHAEIDLEGLVLHPIRGGRWPSVRGS